MVPSDVVRGLFMRWGVETFGCSALLSAVEDGQAATEALLANGSVLLL